MKIRMKVQISGTRDGQDWPAVGGEVNLPDDEGAQLCATGLAEPVGEGEPENAAAPDTSEKRPARSRKGVITKE